MSNQLVTGNGTGHGYGYGNGTGTGTGNGNGNGYGDGNSDDKHINSGLVHSGYLTDIREFTSFQLLKVLIHV